MDYLVDTTFLIGRWRRGPASEEQRFIETHPDSVAGIPWVVKAEFLRGAQLAGHAGTVVKAFLGRYPVVWPDEETLSVYAQVYAELLRNNQLIGPHDLWIAAAAVQSGVPLLTRNVDEFGRVAGVRVEAYAE